MKIAKKGINETIKTSRNNFSNKFLYTYFDNINKISNSNNNNVRKSTPIKEIEIPFKSISNRKYSSKTAKHDIKKDIFINTFNIKDIKINKRKISVNTEDISKSEKSKNNKYNRKIKEIIINKNLNKNSGFVNIAYQLNIKKYLDQRRPIQVNLSLQNTNDSSQNNNIHRMNSCLTECDLKEPPTIIIQNKSNEENRNIGDVESIKKNESQMQYNISNIHINLNKNLKKKKQKEEKRMSVTRNLSANKIKSININFMKKINNKFLNNGEGNINKLNILKTDNDIKTKEDKKNSNDKKDYIKEENVSQFQILPIKIFQKINPKQIKNKKMHSNKENNIYNNKKENSILYRSFKDNYNKLKEKRKIISPKRNETNCVNDSDILIKNEFPNLKKRKNSYIVCNSYKKITQFKNVETFKNSIRNKYKMEKRKKEV